MAIWTVARYPNGTWGKPRPNDPAYDQSEVFHIHASHRGEAVEKAKHLSHDPVQMAR
jgi:hypothetical protein